MKVARFVSTLGIVAAFAAASLFADGAQAQKPEPKAVSVGFVAKLALSWPLYVADNKGWYAAYGLKLEPVMTGQSAKVVQAITSGAVHLGHAGAPEVIRGIEQGAGIKLISAEVAVPPYKVMAKKDITRVEDLKGKKVMIGGTKDITYIYMKAMFEKHGLKMSDVDFLYSGSTTNRFAALVQGGVDAAILASPFDFQAASQGFSNLGLSKTYSPDSPFTAYAVNSDWAAKNRATVVSFLKGYVRGIRWLYEPANRDEATALLIKETNAKPDDAAKTYDFYFGELQAFRKDGRFTEAALNDLLKSLVILEEMKEPFPPYSKYVDNSFLQEALTGLN
jgi:NitT/TauT family transport system substrate-binding protein